NWDSYGHKVGELTETQRYVLADPQTSGGLLIAVESRSATEFKRMAQENGFDLHAFGELVEQREKVVYVN
ncbi:MAG TPA: selenide, water dikinase SelD, partial [Hymenobacter sp.]|nr:selenide, water dikinase SelD [Hymenobacter sp.]